MIMIYEKEKKIKIVEILKKEYPCDYVLNFIRSTKHQCNSKLDRLAKADIRDKLCERSRFFKYVDKNGNDVQFKYPNPKLDLKLEIKSSSGFLYTKSGSKRGQKNPQGKLIDPIVPVIEICNSNSFAQSKKIPEGYSDIIVCEEPLCISLLFVQDLIPFLHSKPGKLIARNVPINLFYKLMDVNDDEFVDLKIEYNLQNRFNSMKREAIKEYDDIYNDKLLQYTSNLTSTKNKTKENEMKETDSDRAYKLICNCDNFYLDKLSKLFLDVYGQHKTTKQCFNYCENLMKAGKIIKEKIITETGRKNLYSVNKQSNIGTNQNKTTAEDMSKELADNSARFGITLTSNNKSVRIENIHSLELLREAALIAKEAVR